MRIALFIIPCAALGIVLGIVATGVKKGTNIFKTQAVAWVITAVMIVIAIGIGIERSPLSSPKPENVPAPTHAPSASAPVPSAALPSSSESYVWDNAHVLSDRTIQELDTRNEVLWTWYSASIGVVTCDYGGDDLYSYAMQCAEDMGLGGYDFIVVLDISGDNYWLVQGDDIRRDFTDNDCSNYAYDYMERDFARGNYDQAVLNLTEALGNWYERYY